MSAVVPLTLLLLWLLLSVSAYTHAPSSCDCGVVWHSFGEISDAPATADVGLQTQPTVYTTTQLQLISSGAGGENGYIWPVVNIQQAKTYCYTIPLEDCTGFVFVPATVTQTGYAHAYLFNRQRTAGSVLATAWLDVDLETASLYELRVYHYNRCSDPTFDPFFYYFSQRRLEIEEYACPYRNSTSNACCWMPFNPTTYACPTPSPSRLEAEGEPTQLWTTSARTHWERLGHSIRAGFAPNANCLLEPLLFTTDSMCTTPQDGCGIHDTLPCGGTRGYCDPNSGPTANPLYSTPYVCNCDAYDSGTYGGAPRFVGRSCAKVTSDSCVWVENPAQLCSGNNARCVAQLDAGSAPNNDYTPRCDCDSAPALPKTGDYCQIDRCDPAHACQIRGVDAGQCVVVSQTPLLVRCDCGLEAVGPRCEYSAVPCIDPEPSIAATKCYDRGVCNQPGLSSLIYPSAQNPNFAANASWCLCTAQQATGVYCQTLTCDPATVTPGRGLCDPTTQGFIQCYKVYDTSAEAAALKCDVDVCARTGGLVIRDPAFDQQSIDEENRYTCACGSLLTASQITPPTDAVGCFPRCANASGVVCGAASGVNTNTCRVTVGSNYTRYADCDCAYGHIHVPAPKLGNDVNIMHPSPNKGYEVCETWCLHGDVPTTGWTEENKAAVHCQCQGTGYTVFDDDGRPTFPRCDNPLCKNNGTWAPSTQSCQCSGPFTSESSCRTDTCDIRTTFYTEGAVVVNPSDVNTRICQCKAPFTYPSPSNKFSCTASMCGVHGVVNPAILNQPTILVLPTVMCLCQPGWRTQCTDPSGASCVFCMSASCLNGGAMNSTTGACVCAFPFIGETCAIHACAAHGTPSNGGCACSYGFFGDTCSNSPCGPTTGTFNETTKLCDCIDGLSLSDCFHLPQPVPSSSSSTGVSGNASSSSSSTGAHHSSSTGVPSSAFRLTQRRSHLTLLLFVYITIALLFLAN